MPLQRGQNGIIRGYNVQVVEADSGSIVQEITLKGVFNTTTVILNLVPFTLYTFKVSGRTVAGIGPEARISSRTPQKGAITNNFDLNCAFTLQTAITQLELVDALDSRSPVVQTHLGEIADTMHEWEGSVADNLELTRADVASIKTKYPNKLNLQALVTML